MPYDDERKTMPDWYDTHCPTCDAPEPTHTATCAVVHSQGQVTEAMVQAAANVMNAMLVADPMWPWIDIARAALEAAEEGRRG